MPHVIAAYLEKMAALEIFERRLLALSSMAIICLAVTRWPAGIWRHRERRLLRGGAGRIVKPALSMMGDCARRQVDGRRCYKIGGAYRPERDGRGGGRAKPIHAGCAWQLSRQSDIALPARAVCLERPRSSASAVCLICHAPRRHRRHDAPNDAPRCLRHIGLAHASRAYVHDGRPSRNKKMSAPYLFRDAFVERF